MRQITRLVQPIGNGAHVVLPKEAIGQTVVITPVKKSMEDITHESIAILKPYLKHIQGIYVHGSHARGETTPESDIDLLVITDGKAKVPKRIREYEIMSTSLEGLKKTLQHTAPLVLPALREAVAILNEPLIEQYRKYQLTHQNTRWYLDTTESALALARESLEIDEDLAGPVYSLVLRLRTLMMLESLTLHKRFSNKRLESYLNQKGISRRTAQQIYRMYQETRDDRRAGDHDLSREDIIKLHSIVAQYFDKVRLLWEKPRTGRNLKLTRSR